jgi:N-acyl-L-homoserine lactone synthetase/ectoine hydroxylase-related dioxygenase (phytanoyl-CoA dioxygenase family)
MVMIFEGAQRPLGNSTLRAMFEARKRVFVDLLKWDVPVLAGRFELDQFDDERAVYLVVADPEGAHLGSARLLETMRPHILDTFFPELCAAAPPRSPGILEITRFCLDRGLPARERLAVRNRLVCAFVDYALQRGLTGFTGVAGMGWLQQILAFGWRCRPLGLPRTIGGRMLGALAIEIGPETPALLARNGIESDRDRHHQSPLAARQTRKRETMDLTKIARSAERLLAEGYCVIPDLLPNTIAELDRDLAEDFQRTPFCKGGFYGERTKRFGRLLARSRHAEAVVMNPLVTGIVREILSPWCDTVQLNLTQTIALHPGALPQLPHRDQDMWRGAIGEVEYLVNVMWPFTPYTEENGATLIWPESHGPRALLAEVAATQFPVELSPGSALLFLGSTLHGAGGNRTDLVRRGAIVSYCLGWLKPYENQWLACPPEIARRFPPELAAMVGYRQHRPNLGNYEGQCPSVLLEGDRDAPFAATDALRPDQAAMVADYVDGQKKCAA